MIPADAPHYTLQYLPFFTMGIGLLMTAFVVAFLVMQFRHIDDD